MARIGDTWGSLRGILREHPTFAQIKDLVGAAGLPVHKLSHIRQLPSAGASKGQLMDAVDGLVSELDDEGRDRFVTACIAELLRRQGHLREEVEAALSRVGWGISGIEPYPLTLRIDLESTSLTNHVRAGLTKCLARYRDGDFGGAITAICGIVDHLTEQIYSDKPTLGNHRKDGFQQRVNKTFSALGDAYKRPLLERLTDKEMRQLWEDHQAAVNRAGGVLAVFRRKYSDVHGIRNAPPEIVQHALDCAVFVIRSFAGLIQRT